MKLIEALRIANHPRSGPPFRALLACGFTPLHLETAFKAHLCLALPDRKVEILTGLYGDVAGTLENASHDLNAAVVILEWADLDPRLGWRSMGPIGEDVVSNAEARLNRIAASIEALAPHVPVALSFPALNTAPVFLASRHELGHLEARLRELVYRMAGATSAVVLHPDSLSRPGHDLRSELQNGFPYVFTSACELAAGLVRALLPPPPKKGLITDLDETLWSGVLGDDGPNGISWDLDRKTYFHSLYQHLLNSLAESGTLIGVASKNDEELVATAFARSDLVVDPRHLFPIEAHWRPKPESIARTLATWNVGADSVVFVDDNPLELEQVAAAFPDMVCLLFRRDDPALLDSLRNLFGKRSVGKEDALRTSSLRQGQAIRDASADAVTLDLLLQDAKARILFRCDKSAPDPRALELINKTNQFNLNGRRYADADWRDFLGRPDSRLIVAEYEDRFGKLGRIAVLAGTEEGALFRIETWVMSCRAFSRRIEHQCLKLLLERSDRVEFRFERTDRNGPTRDFLAEIGAAGTLAVTRAEFECRCPVLYHQTEIIDA